MRYPQVITVLLFLVVGCSSDPYNPDTYLSKEEQKQFVRNTTYYTAKLAPRANHENKFDDQFSWYYDRAAAETDLRFYYVDDAKTNYFLMTREARSITPMREAIGGTVRFDDHGKIAEYQELFRTWKMPDDTLSRRSAKLFDVMVKGESLEPYYSKHQGDKYIEFPDGRFYFNKDERKWHDSAFDSLGLNQNP